MSTHARGARLGRSVATALVVGAVVWWRTEGVASACSCAQPPAPRVAAAAAAAVFEGRTFVVDREDGKLRFDFEVSRVFKGDVGSRVHVYSASSSAACGRAFETGVPYVVYAHVSPAGVLVDTICSRTRQSRAAAEDLAELGAGVVPTTSDHGADVQPSLEPPRIEPTPSPTSPSRRGCTIADPTDAPSWPSLLLLPLAMHRRRPLALPCPESKP